MKRISFFIIFILIIALLGCKPSDTSSEAIDKNSPDSGKSIIHGQLLAENNKPYEGMIVRLAKVYRVENEGGAFVLDEANSPMAVTEPGGEFYFLNIDPGEYVLFVGTLADKYKVISDADQDPILYSVNPNEILDIELITIEFE